MGGLASTALENIRLEEANDASIRERTRITHQLAMATDVQQGLFPEDFESPPGFDMAGMGRVCEDLSGDYYDVIPRPDGRVAMVVGDVSGHGIPSALYTATARGLLRSLMASDAQAGAALYALNEALGRDLRGGNFVSLFLGMLDPSARTLTYASAGHHVWIRSRDGTLRELGHTGPVLGPIADARFGEEGPITLETGDILLLFTDGIFEAPDEERRRWGEDAFQAAFQRRAAQEKDAHGILTALLDDFDTYRGREPMEDDVTCLVVRAV